MSSTAAVQLPEAADSRAARPTLAPTPALRERQEPSTAAAGALVRGSAAGLIVLVQLAWLAVLAYVMLVVVL